MHKFGAISIVWMVWECGMAEMGGILRYATDFQGTGNRHGSQVGCSAAGFSSPTPKSRFITSFPFQASKESDLLIFLLMKNASWSPVIEINLLHSAGEKGKGREEEGRGKQASTTRTVPKAHELNAIEFANSIGINHFPPAHAAHQSTTQPNSGDAHADNDDSRTDPKVIL